MRRRLAYNDGTNRVNKSANWVPGNTLYLCGTISVPANTNIISAQASGAAGSPIATKFESGAILNSPVGGTGSSACIYLSGHSYITINGGNSGSATGNAIRTPPAYWTSGLVQNNANGSSG